MNNIILLGLVSLINDMSSKIILPILPLYIEQIGGAGLAIGIISGVGQSVSSFLKVLSGHWADKYGKKKPFVFWGYFTSAVAKILLYVATSWPLVLVFRTIERTGKGLRSAPRDALLAGTGTGKSGKKFGIHRAFDSGGAVLGSLIVLVILWQTDLELRTIFLIAGILAFFALIPILFTRETEKQAVKKDKKLIVSFKSLSKQLKFFIAIGTLFSIGNFSWMFFVLFSQSTFDASEKLLFPVILYTIYHFSYTLLAIPSGMLADKIGKARVLMMGYALFGILTLGFMLFNSKLAFVLLFLLYGVMYAFVESNERAYVSDLAPEDTRATALGTFFTMTSIAALPAGLLAGWLYDMAPTYAFMYGFAISFVTVVLFIYGRVHFRKQIAT